MAMSSESSNGYKDKKANDDCVAQRATTSEDHTGASLPQILIPMQPYETGLTVPRDHGRRCRDFQAAKNGGLSRLDRNTKIERGCIEAAEAVLISAPPKVDAPDIIFEVWTDSECFPKWAMRNIIND
jgi:hypothetical protein